MNTRHPQHLIDDLARLAAHEATALAGLRTGMRERWQVARRTRSLGELLRHQIDLLPLTRQRLAEDQRRRRALLLALFGRLTDPARSSP